MSEKKKPETVAEWVVDHEKRIKQLEEDVQDLSAIASELLTWKRNQATKILPDIQYTETPEDQDLEET